MAKRIFALLFSAIVFCSCALAVNAEEVEKKIDSVKVSAPKGYESIAENDSSILYANMSTGDFAIFDRASKHLWYSGQWDVLDDNSPVSELNSGRIKTDLVSVIAINYVQISTIANTAVPSYQNSYAYSVVHDNAKVKKINNGIRTDYYFEDIDATVPVEVVLSNNGFYARIIGDELKIGKEYRIISIDLLPGFMACDGRYNGYLFVPSGCGGLIPFKSGKGDLAFYSETVYGDDAAIEVEEYSGESQNILVPVYGIKCDNSAVAAIITKGDTSASVRAGADSSSTSFTYVYSEYTTSIVDSTTLFESNYENQRIIYGAEDRKTFEDYKVDYIFLSGDNANYSGMAKAYRDYLNLKGKAGKPSLSLNLYGAATKKASFLGIPYTKTIALTSFKDAQKIISDLNKSGVNVSLKYIGWNDHGIENKKIPSVYSPVRVLGGKKGFSKLYNSLKGSENNFYFDLDFTTIRKSGRGYSTFSDVCKSIFNTRTPIYKYMRSVNVPVNSENPSYLLKSADVKKATQKFLSKYKFDGGISLDKIGEEIYSDFSKKGSTRADAKNTFVDVFKSVSEKHSLSVNKGNAYSYSYIDRIFELPTSNDGNLLFSESVPFVQMVLHGSVSYSTQIGNSLLDCLEFGADPSFAGISEKDSSLIETSFNWLYGTTYDVWKENAKKVFKDYNDVYKELYNCQIINHISDNGISVTEYSNGTKIYVNRRDEEALFEGVTVPAKGYKVIGGAAS